MTRFCLCFAFAGMLAAGPAAPSDDAVDSMRYARGAASWLLSVARASGPAMTWPQNDTNKPAPAFNLYSGMPGGILLLAELAREDPAGPYAQAVRSSVAGLESLRAGRDLWSYRSGEKTETPLGLYTGNAGIAWLYLELHRLTGERRYRDRARTLTDAIVARSAAQQDAGAWSNSTDIISGAAGIGLFFLRAAAEFGDARILAAAIRAGDFLIASAIRTPQGLKWKIQPTFPRLYPNFSHGTSGVSYFLVRLYQETRQQRFLDAAVAGAREMEAIAAVEDNACTWYHDDGGGENLWYVSWCHGPAGTARLFYQLREATGEPAWMDWVDRSAAWLLKSGIPEPSRPINGYWNESVCCGTAGVGDFFVDLYLATGKDEYLNAAAGMAAHLARRADVSGKGFRWIQAENRVSPDEKDAQTGYAQGAAGFGLFFLKLSRARRGKPAGWRFPDNPFQKPVRD